MSIEKEIPTTKKVARAYMIEIDKTDKENPKIVCYYTNDEIPLGQVTVTPQEVIAAGIVTAEEVLASEEVFRKVANYKNPYN